MPAEARESYLDRVCGTQQGLRAEILSLLAAHEGPSLAIESHLLEGLDSAEKDSLLGTMVGSYRLVSLLGEGGMGEVYLGQREDSYEQQVAVKVVRAHLSNTDLVARFRLERQILARLEHPGIGRLLDGGVSEEGRPYLAMEFIRGAPVTEWCNDRGLAVDDRLQIFRQICSIVHFAHRNLVVHRDLKPSNILVTEGGEVRLLDFGIAKLLDGDDVAAVETRSEVRLLTPEHAAPEQILGEPITTATDVYALGVLLFELLTGKRPFSRESLNRIQLERAICQNDPLTLSRCASRSSTEEMAQQRGHGSGSRLGRQLAGDLDSIVNKALRKEPSERYASAEQLAEEVDRHLQGEPVLARKGAFFYGFRKLVGRHPWAISAVVVGLFCVAAFIFVLSRQATALALERDRAENERDTAEQVVELLTDLLASADPVSSPLGRKTPVGDILDLHADRLIDELADLPWVQARMRQTVASIHLAHSEFDRARALLDAAAAQQIELTGEDHPDAAAILHDQASLMATTGPPDRARELLQASLERHQRLYKEDDVRLAQAMHDFAAAIHADKPAEAEQLLLEALAMGRRLFEGDHLSIASTLAELGLLHYHRDDLDEAETLWSEATDMVVRLHGPDHPHALTLVGNRASLASIRGRHEEAEALHARALEARKRIYGDRSLEVGTNWNNLGVSLVEQGDYAAGEEAFRSALSIFKELLGGDHVQVANTERNLGLTLERQGSLEEAAELTENAAATAMRAGLDREATVYMEAQVAPIWHQLGRTEEAASRLEATLSELEDLRPEGRYTVADVQAWLADVLLDLGEFSRAEILFTSSLEYRASYLPESHRLIEDARCGLARALAQRGARVEAKRLFAICLPILREAESVPDLEAMEKAAAQAAALD